MGAPCALATIYDGGSRAQAAETGGVTRQIVRDWVVKFNAEGPEGLIDRKIPGRPSKLEETHRDALRRLIESGPIPAGHRRDFEYITVFRVETGLLTLEV